MVCTAAIQGGWDLCRLLKTVGPPELGVVENRSTGRVDLKQSLVLGNEKQYLRHRVMIWKKSTKNLL